MNDTIQQIRSFNRFYTSHIGLLNKDFLESPYSLTEVRILYEIGTQKAITAQSLCTLLHLDKGYVSRILNSLSKKEIISRMKSDHDARSYLVTLTPTGQKLLQDLQSASDGQIGSFASDLGIEESQILTNAMQTIQGLLGEDYDKRELAKKVTFREGLQSGDIGYLIHLHGLLYAKESGYSLQFEAYVAKTFYDFIGRYSKENDRVWLAEYNRQIVGCIAIVHHSEDEAQLRWFLTHPTFRGFGIGGRLLDTAMEYCQKKAYKKIFLMTTNVQERAIAMYTKVGFVKTKSIESKQWGKALYEERFDLDLQ